MIDLNSFALAIKTKLYEQMPLEMQTQYEEKHSFRGDRMKNVALGVNNVYALPNGSYAFELGNDKAEEKFPYYHILEDAQVISKREKGTKGSQDKVANAKNRDYGIIKISKSNNVYQEYRKNVRGKRSLRSKATRVVTDYNGNKFYIDKESKYYYNEHYRYVERIMELYLPFISKDFGLVQKRTQIDDDFISNLGTYIDTMGE